MELLDAMIALLCAERGERVPTVADADKPRLWRALVNVRPPMPASTDYLSLEDAYLQGRLAQTGTTSPTDLVPMQPDIYLWQGDITTLAVDWIVNAANSQMLGCFCPNHDCIDNAIHTFAGVRLRWECAELMKAQGHAEPTGEAKITHAYNLPCKYILHTVGPIVYGELTEKHERQLASCYRSCLALADENGLESLAFCCISTGAFHFPNERAAEIAVQTVREYKRETESKIKVVFNVFKERDHEIYANLLGAGR